MKENFQKLNQCSTTSSTTSSSRRQQAAAAAAAAGGSSSVGSSSVGSSIAEENRLPVHTGILSETLCNAWPATWVVKNSRGDDAIARKNSIEKCPRSAQVRRQKYPLGTQKSSDYS